MFFRFQGWLPPIDVNSYPIKYRSSTYTNTNSNVCPEAVLLQFQMYLLFYVSKHFLWFVVFFQHRQQWPESDSTGLGDDLHQQVMLWTVTRCYIANNIGRISRVKTQEIWQLDAWGVFSAGPGRQLRLRCHRVWEIQESFVICICIWNYGNSVWKCVFYGWWKDSRWPW